MSQRGNHFKAIPLVRNSSQLFRNLLSINIEDTLPKKYESKVIGVSTVCPTICLMVFVTSLCDLSSNPVITIMGTRLNQWTGL